MKPAEFVSKYKGHAMENEIVTGVPYLITLAQGALESGWGAHAPGNNFFGIKPGKNWNGKVQSLNTTEYIKGVKKSVKCLFRAYDKPLECFKDHAEVLKNGFPKAFQFRDPIAFIRSVQNQHFFKDGRPKQYATDPDYTGKIERMILMIKKAEIALSGNTKDIV